MSISTTRRVGRGQALPAWAWLGVEAVMACFSLWLAGGRKIQFLDQLIDDFLFARLANSLRDGSWLGAYDKLTLAKGPGYPAFLAVVSAAGIPLRLAEQAVYLSGCWLVAHVVGRLSGRRWLAALVFAAGSLNPVAWGVSLDRIIRENFYLGLTVVVLGLAMRLLLEPARPWPRFTRTLLWGASLGAASGWFWLTREEGLWLVPPLGVLVLDWLARRWASRPRSGLPRYLATSAAVLLVPCLSFAAVDLTVATINRRTYGVFETSEFRSAEFKAAYGALLRIKHDHWQRLIPFPKDARAAAYAVSPAARELAPSLDGVIGAAWKSIGCSWLPITPCDDIQSGWFVWAFREAVEAAGHYRSARDARSFYARLAKEVNAACDAGTLRCLPARSGLAPPFRREYIPFVAEDTWQLLRLLALLGGEPPADACSDESPSAIRVFQRVALGPWTPGGAACHPDLQGDVRVAGWVLAPSGPIRVRAEAAQEDTLATPAAPDVPLALQQPTAVAARFAAVIHCGHGPCRLVADAGGTAVERDVSALSYGYAANTPGLRLWIDEVSTVKSDWPDWSRPQRTVAVAVSATLRAASPVLLPVAALLALCFAVLDLASERRLRRLTTVWLVLLVAMGMRVGLLAVLNATSLPAIATLYLSPAVGLALLLIAGVAGDAAIRLRVARTSRSLRPGSAGAG